MSEKQEIIRWLNTEVGYNAIVFDYVLDIKDKILSRLDQENLKLRNGEDIFLMNLIYYLYQNSFIE